MAIRNSFRAALVVIAVGLAAGAGWLEFGARREGFAGWLDRRAALASGIVDPAEWTAMRKLGDVAGPTASGTGCGEAACRSARAMLEGRWRGGADCGAGSIYRFDDSGVDVEDLVGDRSTGVVRRQYRIAGGDVGILAAADAEGRPLGRVVEKRRGDLEVWTVGRSAYVRRVFRKIDADTVMLVVVQNRIGRDGPVRTLYIEGKSTVGPAEVTYRRCRT